MRYVLQRSSDGKFVTREGSEHSYSHKLQDARVFRSKLDAAVSACCENERIVPLNEVLAGGE
jgi:hypothetical protein